MSKQREYQKRMKAAGNCTQCGKKRGRGAECCDECLHKKAANFRRRYHEKYPDAVRYNK